MFGINRLIFAMAALLIPLLAQAAAQQTTDSCIACHTDATKLRALAKAPAPAGDEEGEG